MFLGHPGLRLHFVFHIHRLCLQHTAGSRNTDIRQFLPDFHLQLLFHTGDLICHRGDIVNLSIDHGTRRMLQRFLCHNNKTVRPDTITNGPNNTSCTNIQAKYIIFSAIVHSHPSFISYCPWISPLLSSISHLFSIFHHYLGGFHKHS